MRYFERRELPCVIRDFGAIGTVVCGSIQRHFTNSFQKGRRLLGYFLTPSLWHSERLSGNNSGRFEEFPRLQLPLESGSDHRP
jgi:hypothetical protein